jgi:hypothetical protein
VTFDVIAPYALDQAAQERAAPESNRGNSMTIAQYGRITAPPYRRVSFMASAKTQPRRRAQCAYVSSLAGMRLLAVKVILLQLSTKET